MPQVGAFEPLLWNIATFVDGPRAQREERLVDSGGASLIVPGAYRDSRTLAAGLYEPEVTQVMKGLIKSGMTVIDAGAYIGYYTVLASIATGPRGRVYSFEPNPTAVSVLIRNVAANRLTNVTVETMALSNHSGDGSLAAVASGAETHLDTGQSSTSVAIPLTSLDDYFQRRNWPPIDIVKMDIEGSEHHAIAGMEELSRRNRSMRLVIEFNPSTLRRSGISGAELARRLALLGFCRAFVIENNVVPLPAHRLTPSTDFVCNLLLTKNADDR